MIQQRGLEDAEASEGGSAQIIDLMEVLRKSLSKNAVVSSAGAGEPISLAERRKSKAPARRKAAHKRSKRA